MSIISHHPTLELKDHISQVKNAVDFLISFHSPMILSEKDKDLLNKIILFHDLGKGNSYFQEYIKNPKTYKKPSNLKSHSFLSSLITGIFLLKNSSCEEIFIALQVISGHHTRLQTIEGLTDMWCDDENIRTLSKQLEHYPTEEIARLIGIPSNHIDLSNESPADIILDYLEDHIERLIKGQSEDNAICFRLKTQLLYSLLLEADKAFLAVPDINKHFRYIRHDWKIEWIDKIIGNPPQTKVNLLRHHIRHEVIQNAHSDYRIFTLTSPTGSGKTFLAAAWAFIQKRIIKQTKGINPKIIIVLPFLSIINQTVHEYEKILQAVDKTKDGSWILPCHSLSDRKYSEMLEKKEESFFIDTWRSDVIITTYDQFLYAIMNPGSKHQLRFHNLIDAIVIMDEVQSLPAKLWIPLEKLLDAITSISNSKILLMSATLPAFVKKTKSLLPDYKKLFTQFNRYNLIVKDIHYNRIRLLQSFIEGLKEEIPRWIENKERVLITLNTRKSAQEVYIGISNYLKANELKYPMYFISSDVIPLDRLGKIEDIKSGIPCIVVSTQSIEAGVDIDMTRIIRDFAPLDSLIQIAGRCNRNGNENTPKNVEIVQLKSNSGKLFCDMIYNDVHLEKTRKVLAEFSSIYEQDILKVTENYFDLLMGKDGVDTGKQLINQFAYWQEYESIKTILRGEDIEKYDLCLFESDPGLIEIVEHISSIEDRWERREEWKRISGRIAQITVSVIARKKFNIHQVAEDFYGLLKLDPAYYDKNIGFRIPGEDSSTWIL
jgi:CRISPR-associated endonuclease/helicase Cas3